MGNRQPAVVHRPRPWHLVEPRRERNHARRFRYPAPQRINHWVRIQLEGTQSNREAIGARIKLIAGELTLIDELKSGRGYQSHYGTLSHFGLGQEKKIDQVEIWWPSGKKQIFKNIPVDRVVKFTEDRTR